MKAIREELAREEEAREKEKSGEKPEGQPQKEPSFHRPPRAQTGRTGADCNSRAPTGPAAPPAKPKEKKTAGCCVR